MEQSQIEQMRHSGAHLLAAAVQKLFPRIQLAIGPAIDYGFYYDFDFGDTKVSENDFPRIEAEMLKLKKAKIPFEKVEMTIAEAKTFLKEKNQPYSLNLLEDIEKLGSTVKGEQSKGKRKKESEKVTFYKSGEFINLCRGGHVENFGEVGEFKIMSLAGAYFRGSEKNPMLTRIYVACFETKKELEDYIRMHEEAKLRDHRVLGPELGIFMFSDVVGSGLPLLLPKGETIKHTLIEHMREKEERLGYRYVSTPVITQEGLYQRSGHAVYYKNDMYSFVDAEGTRFYIKPMNCPHHHMIYEKIVKSYRDLPLKLAEACGLYRHELSGTLTGLIRVRGPITQNDSHIYVREDQLKEEFLNVLALFQEVYNEMGIKGYWFRLSLPDFKKDKYGGEKKRWIGAGDVIREALQEFGVPFVEAEGEAAFYGPKLDVQIKNVTGKEDTIATSQVDILVPERMGLTYVDDHGQEVYPIIIHRAILGSYERFIGFLLEQTAGNLPFWLAPVQIQLLSVNDECNDSMKSLASELRNWGYRVDIDLSSESIGKKIRTASLQKIPAKIVVGKEEIKTKQESGKWILKVNWRSDLAQLGSEPTDIDDLVTILEELRIRKGENPFSYYTYQG